MRKLVVLVDSLLMESEEIKALNPKTVSVTPLGFKDVDLVIGPKCWYMPPSHLRYLPVAIKSARARVKKEGK